MNILQLLIKLWPAISTSIFGGGHYSSYMRKNKVIFVLLLTLVINFVCFLYMFEQATMHGVRSKQLEQKIANYQKQKRNLHNTPSK